MGDAANNAFGKDFKQGYKVTPTMSEYNRAPESFIYCSNGACGLAGSGLCRIFDGPLKNLVCRHCNTRFPAKPNGRSFGGLHYKAMLAGKPTDSGKGKGRNATPGNGKGGGNGKGKGAGKSGAGGKDGSRLDNMESAITRMADTISKLANAPPASYATQFPAIHGRDTNRKPPLANAGKGANNLSGSVWADPSTAEAKAVESVDTHQVSGSDVLLSKVQKEFAVPPGAAAQITELIIKNQTPIAPVQKVLKPTAQSQKIHEAYQASIISVSGLSASIATKAARLEALCTEQDELVSELQSLDSDMAKAKQLEHQCYLDFKAFEERQNSVSAKAAAGFCADASTMALCEKLYQATAGNPLCNQLGEMLKSLCAAHSKQWIAPAAPVAGQFPVQTVAAVASDSGISQSVSNNIPQAAASTQASDFEISSGAAKAAAIQRITQAPITPIIADAGVTADNDADAHMGLPSKRQGSGDEEQRMAWQRRAAKIAAARGDITNVIASSRAAESDAILTSNKFAELGYSDHGDSEPSFGDMCPQDDDIEGHNFMSHRGEQCG